MMRLFFSFCAVLLSFSVLAQDEGWSDPQACNYRDESENCYYCVCDYGIEVEAVHTEGELAGMTTYRYYVTTSDPEEALISVYGNAESPLLVESSTSFYQHIFGSALGSHMYPELYPSFPELEYDSWVTIGLDEVPGEGEAAPTTIVSPDFNWVSQFESGGDIEIDDSVGGGWFVFDPSNTSNTISGDDNKILVMQLTMIEVVCLKEFTTPAQAILMAMEM